MNPIEETINEYITEIKFNVEVILDAVDLGPPPSRMIRTPSHNASEEEEMQLIPDDSFPDFQNTPNNFVMPEPCEQCYVFCCNGQCSQETVLIPRQLSFEEEMVLPPPPALTRRVTSVYLPDEEWKDTDLCPPPFTRMYTNDHLPADELEDESDEFDMPEGIQYVSISINKDDKLLSALSEAESNARDEYEETFFKGLEDKKQNQDK